MTLPILESSYPESALLQLHNIGTPNVIEGLWSHTGPQKTQGTSRMDLAFSTPVGLRLSQAETLSFSPGLFIVTKFIPLASLFPYPKTSSLSLSKGQCQMQILD